MTTEWEDGGFLDDGVRADSTTVPASSTTVTALGYSQGTSAIIKQKSDWASTARVSTGWTSNATFDTAVQLDSTTVQLDSATVTLLGYAVGVSPISNKVATNWTPAP